LQAWAGHFVAAGHLPLVIMVILLLLFYFYYFILLFHYHFIIFLLFCYYYYYYYYYRGHTGDALFFPVVFTAHKLSHDRRCSAHKRQ